MDRFELEIDRRQRLGLPATVLAEAGLTVGEVIRWKSYGIRVGWC